MPCNEKTYVNILNSQLPNFQFKVAERLETRFTLLANKAHRDLRTKFQSGRKRNTYMTSTNNVAVFENELENVKELNSSLAHFCKEKLEFEERCATT